jgi:RES domain-containing protein
MEITPHPGFARMEARLRALAGSFDVRFEGELFRFINPAHAKATDIVSGAGARFAAGRWNLPRAEPLSYTALRPETALAEALAHVNYYRLPVARALPRVLVALHLKAQRALDLRTGKLRQALRFSEAVMRSADWRADNQRGREATTQAWGRAIARAGFEALIVPSAADAAGGNVLVFPQNLQAGSDFDVQTELEWQ